jgi:hypothetical protein
MPKKEERFGDQAVADLLLGKKQTPREELAGYAGLALLSIRSRF